MPEPMETPTEAPAPVEIALEDQTPEQLEATMTSASAGTAVEPTAAESESASITVEAPLNETDPPPPSAPSDFTFSTLANGQHEMRLANGEVYRGATEREVMEKLAAGKMETNRYVQKLKTEIPAAPPPAPSTPPPPAIDPTAELIADFTAQGMGFANAKEMRAAFQGLQQSVAATTATSEDYRVQQASTAFLQSARDFVPTSANAERLDEGIQYLSRLAGVPEGRTLPITVDLIQAAHELVKGRGLYEAAPANPVPAPNAPARTASGQFAPRTNIMPPPPGANSPQASLKSQPSMQEIWDMPLDKQEEFMDSLSRA